MPSLTELDSYKKLQAHYNEISSLHMRDIFANDENRFREFSLKFGDLLFDFSKNRVTEATIPLLANLARECKLTEFTGKMFSGEKINFTESRAVLHTALRNKSGSPVIVDGEDIMPKINSVKEQMQNFCESVHSGSHKGYTGKKIDTIVNIGIGGSDLGPAMVVEALKPYALEGINSHFVSNVDGTDIAETLKKLNPETTLFIISSKSFTTQETLTNGNTAKNWFLEKSGGDNKNIASHFIAISTNEKAVREFGIDTANMFGFWDWVGGRYSLWSSIGMSIALSLGYDNFEKLLDGAHAMDTHFRETPYEKNIPVLMAMLGVWYSNFFNAATHAVIPYDQYMRRFPEYLQQLDMESNGKRIDRQGNSVDYTTGPVIWGVPGTNSQHSFFQLIHQGTQMIPADFLAAVESHNPVGEHQKILLSNFFAQTEALMKGKNAEEARIELENSRMTEDKITELLPHKIFPGTGRLIHSCLKS
jgi:glucose-6-phosphate isomerase